MAICRISRVIPPLRQVVPPLLSPPSGGGPFPPLSKTCRGNPVVLLLVLVLILAVVTLYIENFWETDLSPGFPLQVFDRGGNGPPPKGGDKRGGNDT